VAAGMSATANVVHVCGVGMVVRGGGLSRHTGRAARLQRMRKARSERSSSSVEGGRQRQAADCGV